MSDYVYKRTELELWTVGFYEPNGKWQPESDHGSEESASKRVAYLNGSSAEADLQAVMTRAAQLEADNQRIRFASESQVKLYQDLVNTVKAERDEALRQLEQAVSAEREACAKVACQAVMRVKTGTQQARDMTLAEFRSVCSCAAEDAIRARK